MNKLFYSLGLMSGTSGDGVDASIISSNGINKHDLVLNKYFEYDQKIYEDIHKLRESINNSHDYHSLKNEISELEKTITLFHAKVINSFSQKNIDLVGFHGQTIYHNVKEGVTKQLGDGKLLSKLTKKTVVYNFRENDLKKGGHGAPLTPIFHKLLASEKKIDLPAAILNIGGIANLTLLNDQNSISSSDIGPGNCLIDKWVRMNSKKKYDENGEIAKLGKVNKIILDQALENFFNNDISKNRSYDTMDFDLSFVRGLSLEDGAATLTHFTAEILSKQIPNNKIFLCGGGRKNKYLIKNIQKNIKGEIKLIDDIGVDGDFVESQAFAYLAIRSFLNLPISFPETTGVKLACTGGVIVKY